MASLLPSSAVTFDACFPIYGTTIYNEFFGDRLQYNVKATVVKGKGDTDNTFDLEYLSFIILFWLYFFSLSFLSPYFLFSFIYYLILFHLILSIETKTESSVLPYSFSFLFLFLFSLFLSHFLSLSLSLFVFFFSFFLGLILLDLFNLLL